MIQHRPSRMDFFPEHDHRSCVHALFEAQVEQRPGAVALSGQGWSLTYRELNLQANRLAHHLRSLGVGEGTVVGVLLPRSRDAVVGLLAILKSGGAYLPLDPSYPAERLRFLVADAGAELIVSDTAYLPGGPSLPAPLLLLGTDREQIAHAPSGNPAPVTTGRSLAYMIYTSGSTGTPKGVQIEHAGIGNLVSAQTFCPFGPQEVHLMLSSLAFDFSTLELWGALLNGARLAVYEAAHLSLTDLGRTIREQRVTTLMITPGVLNHLVGECLPDLAGLRRVLTGGDVPSPKTVRLLLEGVPGCGYVNLYGPTENTVLTTAYVVRDPEALEATLPIGRAIHGTETYVMTGDGVRARPGEVGEMWLGGVGLARGYANRPELTAAQFVPHPFDPRPGKRLYRTGDLVRERPDGQLEFLGRRDAQVKIRGHRIELPEIERALSACPDVQEAVVLALSQGEQQEKRLVAFVEVVPSARDRAQALTDHELRLLLGRSLPGYMVPSLMVHVEALPIGPTGKVDRHALAAWPLPGPAADAPAAEALLSGTEVQLGAIWAEVLGSPVGGRPQPQADFFALGGTSLQAALLLSRVATHFGTEIPVGLLFERPTLGALAALIDERHSGTGLTAARPATDDLVCLRRPSARNAGAAPLLLIGNPYLYRRMLLGLNLDAPIYALQQDVQDVTVLAASALARLRRAGIAGPYRLLGFSFDGLVAYELARQLHEAGETVSFVGLIDTPTPEIERRWQELPMLQRVGLRLRHLPWMLHPERRHILVDKALARITRRFRPRSAAEQESDRSGRALFDARLAMIDLYRPRPFSGPVTLFRATGEYFELLDPLLGWGHLTGDRLRVENVRGGHLDLLLSAEGSRQISALLGTAFGEVPRETLREVHCDPAVRTNAAPPNVAPLNTAHYGA